ncbi:MAG: hypothetical protein IKE94_01225 [Aeriscardovia sp.]|nr:hypothetical protein [Aeriscardovia sp.]
MKEFRLDEYLSVIADEHCCLFCVNCTDVFYDSHSVYMVWCEFGHDVECGMRGECWCFAGDER